VSCCPDYFSFEALRSLTSTSKQTGFNHGDKARGREVQMAVEMSQHGYVCMSINYKLWNKGIKSIQPINP
jgi:hypothetical protein